jgi:hypothetical protein
MRGSQGQLVLGSWQRGSLVREGSEHVTHAPVLEGSGRCVNATTGEERGLQPQDTHDSYREDAVLDGARAL